MAAKDTKAVELLLEEAEAQSKERVSADRADDDDRRSRSDRGGGRLSRDFSPPGRFSRDRAYREFDERDRDRRGSNDRDRNSRGKNPKARSHKGTDTEDEDHPYRGSRNDYRGRDDHYRRRSPSPRRDRRNEMDYYRPGRDRDRDRDRRSRDRSRSPRPNRYRSYRDEDDRRGRRDDRRGGGRYGRRSTPKRSPSANIDEKDRRTVFVQQLSARLTLHQLESFFSKVGPVADAKIVTDRVSNRSKGLGYVEFKDEESVAKALELTGQKLIGVPIIVQLTEAEKNRQARQTDGNNASVPFHRLYVGNIHFSVTEEDIKSVFEPFGAIEFVSLQHDDNGRSKGYGFVQFKETTAAKQALDIMNNFELAGRHIRVGLGNDNKFPNDPLGGKKNGDAQGSAFSGIGGRGIHAGGSSTFDRAGGRDGRAVTGASALDDTDVAGVNFNNYDRDSLMRKLARLPEPAPAARGPTIRSTGSVVQDRPIVSRCIQISNVCDPENETEEGWAEDITADIGSECGKFGKVLHVALDQNSNGDVFLKFEKPENADKALKGLNGRLFGGRMLAATTVLERVYDARYPAARTA